MTLRAVGVALVISGVLLALASQRVGVVGVDVALFELGELALVAGAICWITGTVRRRRRRPSEADR